eukprot:m.81937 g.81937  ORF g.81937 m.81937 type:complete len:216 (-) comp50759_c0_seq2:58-705(-)
MKLTSKDDKAKDRETSESEPRARTFMELAKDPQIFWFALRNCIISFGFWIPSIYLVKYAENSLNIDHDSAVWSISMIGASSTVSRIVIGFLSDYLGPWRLRFWMICVILNGAMAIVFLGATDFLSLMVITAFFGLTSGAFITMEPLIVAEFAPPVDVPKAFGIVHAVDAPAALLGPPLVGWIVEASDGSYLGCFLFAGLTMICSNLFVLLAKARR